MYIPPNWIPAAAGTAAHVASLVHAGGRALGQAFDALLTRSEESGAPPSSAAEEPPALSAQGKAAWQATHAQSVERLLEQVEQLVTKLLRDDPLAAQDPIALSWDGDELRVTQSDADTSLMREMILDGSEPLKQTLEQLRVELRVPSFSAVVHPATGRASLTEASLGD